MTPGVLIWMGMGGLILAGLAATAAKGLREFSRHELEVYCRVRKRRELFGEIHDNHEQVALSVESLQTLGTTLAILAGSWCLVAFGPSGAQPAWGALVLWFAFSSLALLMATVWIPWAIVRLWSAPFLFHTWRMWRSTSRATSPLSQGAHLVDAVMHRLAGRKRERPTEEEFEDEIRAIVSEGLRDGVLEQDAREMIEGVIELGDVDVADVMTPRSDVDAIDVGLDWHEMLDFVIQVRRTRIPVYDKKLDNIVGILYAKDLLPELAKGPDEPRRPLREILREPWLLPKTKPVDDLLQEFQRSRKHIAIVVDEYTAVAGVVTIEDVLEEIVGEIVDEYDQDVEEQIVQVNESTAEMAARVHVDEVNDQLALDLPEEDEFDTIGGFVSMQLGHIPTRGEQISWENVRITVLEASRRRVERVRVGVLETPQRETA